MQRLRSPLNSKSRVRIQVSVSEEMPTSVCSAASALVFEIDEHGGDLPRFLKKSIKRISME